MLLSFDTIIRSCWVVSGPYPLLPILHLPQNPVSLLTLPPLLPSQTGRNFNFRNLTDSKLSLETGGRTIFKPETGRRKIWKMGRGEERMVGSETRAEIGMGGGKAVDRNERPEEKSRCPFSIVRNTFKIFLSSSPFPSYPSIHRIFFLRSNYAKEKKGAGLHNPPPPSHPFLLYPKTHPLYSAGYEIPPKKPPPLPQTHKSISPP